LSVRSRAGYLPTHATGRDQVKGFVCGAMVPSCDAVLEAVSEEALIVDIVAHARDAHGMHEVPPEVMDAIRATITDR
jgi:predicted small metal-binding protein